MTIIIAGLIGAALGGGAVHYWHKTHPIKVGPNPDSGSGDQPPPGGPGQGH